MLKTCKRVGKVFNIKKRRFMKKFRMMLPVLAVIFAIAGAVAGDYLPVTNGYYKIGINCSSTAIPLNEDHCFVSDDEQFPICTVTPSGSSAQRAYEQSNCTNTLRHQ
jgi:hypothetical protein